MQQDGTQADEGIKPQRHKDTELHFVFLVHCASVVQKSSVELPSEEVCDATKAE
jgi:hypothetical protein